MFWMVPWTVSQDITLSEEYHYNSGDGFILMGQVQDTILLFTEKGFDRTIEFFDARLKFLFSKELILEEPRIHINLAIAREKDFTIIYSYEQRFNLFVRAVKFDLRGNPIDSVTLYEEKDFLDLEHFSFVLSNDRSKVVLFRSSKASELECLFFDLESHELVAYETLHFEDSRVDTELLALVLSDSGNLALLFEKYNFAFRRSRHNHHLFIYDTFGNLRNDFRADFSGRLSVSFNVDRDEKNNRFVVGGMFAPKSTTKAEGYYYYTFDENGLKQDIVFEPFTRDLLEQFTGKQRKPKNYIPDLVVRDLVMRNDGGLILIAEMQKEVFRESVRRRYIDYHYEDLILFSIEPDGSLFWTDVIRKYQLSYDDRARYSSFFLFETPSRLQLIFNDEIKNENTISEYEFSPLGNGRRKSLFSTDLHRLKLLFEDAEQLSNRAFAVPSMSNGKFRIVKIEY